MRQNRPQQLIRLPGREPLSTLHVFYLIYNVRRSTQSWELLLPPLLHGWVCRRGQATERLRPHPRLLLTAFSVGPHPSQHTHASVFPWSRWMWWCGPSSSTMTLTRQQPPELRAIPSMPGTKHFLRSPQLCVQLCATCSVDISGRCLYVITTPPHHLSKLRPKALRASLARARSHRGLGGWVWLQRPASGSKCFCLSKVPGGRDVSAF